VYKLLFIIMFFITGCVDPVIPTPPMSSDIKNKVIGLKKDMQIEHIIYINHAESDMFVSNLVYAVNVELEPVSKSMVFKR